MSKHYKVVEYDDSSTIPTRRVVYSGSDENLANFHMNKLRFARSHELCVDGKSEKRVAVVSAGPTFRRRRPRPFRLGDA